MPPPFPTVLALDPKLQGEGFSIPLGEGERSGGRGSRWRLFDPWNIMHVHSTIDFSSLCCDVGTRQHLWRSNRDPAVREHRWGQGSRMQKHRSTQDTVSNQARNSHFALRPALENLIEEHGRMACIQLQRHRRAERAAEGTTTGPPGATWSKSSPGDGGGESRRRALIRSQEGCAPTPSSPDPENSKRSGGEDPPEALRCE